MKTKDGITRRQLRRWAHNAFQHWLEHAGRYTLGGAINATRPSRHKDVPTYKVHAYMRASGLLDKGVK